MVNQWARFIILSNTLNSRRTGGAKKWSSVPAHNPHLCPTPTPLPPRRLYCSLLHISGDHSVQGIGSPDSHVCMYIRRTFIWSLKRSIWLVSSGAGKERNSKRFFASLPPTNSVLRHHLNSSAALRPKDCKSSKRFSLMCQCFKRSSYLNIYLEQGEVLPKSTCPHFSLKRWWREGLLPCVPCWERGGLGWG